MASQNTLTAPADRDKEHLFDFNKNPLTDEQVEKAKEELIDKEHLQIYLDSLEIISQPFKQHS